MLLLYVLLFIGVLAAGLALSDQVLQASEQSMAQPTAGHSLWYARKVLEYAVPELEANPVADIEQCARMVREAKVLPEQAAEAFDQCLGAE